MYTTPGYGITYSYRVIFEMRWNGARFIALSIDTAIDFGLFIPLTSMTAFLVASSPPATLYYGVTGFG